MRIRAVFTKKNYLRYISHLDLVRLFQRSFNRADIPVKFSQGFNPHPKFSIGNPLSLGFESQGEFLDIELEIDFDPTEFKEKMNKVLPNDIQILKAEKLETKKSITSIVDWSHYEIKFMIKEKSNLDFSLIFREWLEKEEIKVIKLRKKGRNKIEIQVNIRPSIGNITFIGIDDNGFIVIEALLKTGEDGNLNPIKLIEALDEELGDNIIKESLLVKRLNLFTEEGKQIRSLL